MFNPQSLHFHTQPDLACRRDGTKRQLAQRLSVVVARIAAVAALLVGSFGFVASAAVPPAGTLINNSATSSQQVGGTPQSSTSNLVTATVGAFGGAPTLVKQFGATSIQQGGATSLSFDIINTLGAPGQVGLAFTDTLPSGLRLAPMPTALLTPGCAATITFPSSSTISITNLSIVAGTGTCRIIISSVTNAVNTQNPQCVNNSASFTNGPASISGLVNLANGVTNQCLLVGAPVITPPNTDLFFSKSITSNSGNSPSTGYRITLRFGNSNLSQATKTNVVIGDVLPAGMTYVPGTLSIATATPLPRVDSALSLASGTFTFNGASGNYATDPSQVSLTFNTMAPGDAGFITFDVNIASGVAVGSVLTNVATTSYTGLNGVRVGPQSSNSVDFTVTGSESITLRGVTIPSVEPGSTVTFNNVLTNNTSRTDSFDISLSGSNYPAGTIFQLFKEDGVTPLTDTNANGTPDAGPVAPGGIYRIVVKAILPPGVGGGPFRVTKNGQSIANPLVRASGEDVVTAINNACRVILEQDNAGTTTVGGTIVYTHVLTNVGTCTERITFPADFLGNSGGGWLAQIVIDNPAGGGQSVVGVIDSTDTLLTASTVLTVPPGGRVVFLNRVQAPTTAAPGNRNTVDLRVSTQSSGVLTNRDTTTIGAATNVENIIQGFIDSGFQRPTAWAFIGRDLFLRANAASCNQQPDVIELRTIVITGPNGEREEIIATETGPNTGIFEASGLPIRRPPVVANDRVLEGNPFDVYSIELIGCGRRIVTSVTLIDPSGVVFDSRTNEPVAGATVRLVTSQGGRCTETPATVSQLVNGRVIPAPNTQVTGIDGRYDFPLVSPGEYCVLVTTPNGYTFTSVVPASQLPGGRNILATGPTSGGSYGGPVRVGPDTGPVIVDIPVDGGPISGLFIQKAVSRTTVEIGDVTDYTVTVNNATGVALSLADTFLTDTLPAGFSYVLGSARLEGKPLADPQGGVGPRLVFNIGRLAVGQTVRATYRVRVGPAATQGDGINRVVAAYRVGGSATRYSESNVAAAQVTIVGGVFSDRSFIIGKVYADCDKSRVQDKGELGIPGVRVYLEDGTNAISDAEGKFSFYGIAARTHVLKVDRTTLPGGIGAEDLIDLSNRNLGKADSRFVDPKYGELQKADFAVKSCTPFVMAEIDARRKAAAQVKTEIDGRLQQQLVADPNTRVGTDVRALPASGVVGTTAPTGSSVETRNLSALPPATILPSNGASSTGPSMPAGISGYQTITPTTPAPQRLGVERKVIEPEIALEQILPQEDNTLGFIGLKEGDTVAYTQSTIRVKGAAGSVFELSVNGKDVALTKVGKKSVIAEKQLQAWEYIGVPLIAGSNTLTIKQVDSFGNARGEQTIRVTAPGEAAKLSIEFGADAKNGALADGKSPVIIVVRVLDGKGVPITARTAITLSASAGRWEAEDLNPAEPGLQSFVQNGRAEFTLLPPTDPTRSVITVTSGRVAAEAQLDFLPDVRDLLAVGLIEGVLNLRKLDTRALVPTRAQDGFEQEIQHLSRTWNDGKYQAGARAAMFIKGKIKGEYLLTLSYDSDKATRERLFRDIQPDEFYPVYGDSSVRGFDAQSTGRFYVRVDNKKSYLLYGDYNTSSYSEARKLANYNRSLTGLKQHFENESFSANVFASRDTTRQLQDEFKANGTSGPFTLGNARGLINSEKIEIITRDRGQSAVIIRTVPLSRFADYELEPLTGRILLKAPVPTLDEFFNPNFIRVTYEVDQGGREFWVVGADAQVKISDRIEIGGTVVEDRNPLDKFRMIGVNAVAKLADKTFLIAEVAQTNRDRVGGVTTNNSSSFGTTNGVLSQGEKRGLASRIELRHQGETLDATLYAGRADTKFDNISSSLSGGRSEVGGRIAYKIDDATRLRAELLRTEDLATNARRDGLLVSAERTLENGLRAEVGVRHARETAQPATATSGALPNEVTSIRGRLTGEVPGMTDLTAYGELEVDPKDTARKIAAIGGEYKLPNNGRLYARHEFISSLTGPYGLTTNQRQNSSVIGLSTDYMKDGNVFGEYRIRDAISGGDAEAAVGLRNMWTIADGLKLQTGLERVHAFSGLGTGESTAATFGLEYTAHSLWKGSTRLELRDGKTQDSLLSTVALASKLDRDWTFLGRNTYSIIKNKGVQSGENEQDRLQLGLAYRDTETDVWNGLARIEHRAEKDTTQVDVQLKRTVELLSLHANWQPIRPFTFGTRYAAKWTDDNSNGLRTKSSAQLLSARGIWEVAPRWDVSLHGSTIVGRGASPTYYGLGLELGFMVMENLWLSGGYNFYGYLDEDFANGDYTNKGAYVRLRYKFDEDVFGKQTPTPKAAPARLITPAPAATPLPVVLPAPQPAPTPAATNVLNDVPKAAPTAPQPFLVAPPAALVQEADTSGNCAIPVKPKAKKTPEQRAKDAKVLEERKLSGQPTPIKKKRTAPAKPKLLCDNSGVGPALAESTMGDDLNDGAEMDDEEAVLPPAVIKQ
jgi:large repetitive protein